MLWDSGGRIYPLLRASVPSMLTAALLVLAFPPFGYPLLAWVALVPLLLQLERSTLLESFWQGLLTGILFYLALMWWAAGIDNVNPLNFIILALYVGLFMGIFTVTGRYLQLCFPGWAPLALPVLWTAIEYLRSHIGFLSHPFGILGYSQYTVLPIAGLAAYTGVYGVSFLLVLINALLTSLLSRRVPAIDSDNVFMPGHRIRWPLPLFGMGILLSGWLAFHAVAMVDPPAEQILKVAIIQGNAYAQEQFSQQRYLQEVLPVYEQLSKEAGGASLVIWPSSSVPGVLPSDRSMSARLGKLARESSIYLLIGAAGLDKFNAEQLRQQRIANSAFLFAPDGQLRGRYDKIRLLPFDEYLPARDFIPWPEWIVAPGMTDHYSGKILTIFEAGLARFGVQICFENMFPDQVRELARNGAHFVVSQTNEAFTTSPAAHYQNFAYYVFRAIENRLPILRSSISGVSCIIDPSGRIVAKVQDTDGKDLGITGIATATISLSRERSFYTRHGDLFAWANVTATMAMIVFGIFVNRNRAHSPLRKNELEEMT